MAHPPASQECISSSVLVLSNKARQIGASFIDIKSHLRLLSRESLLIDELRSWILPFDRLTAIWSALRGYSIYIITQINLRFYRLYNRGIYADNLLSVKRQSLFFVRRIISSFVCRSQEKRMEGTGENTCVRKYVDEHSYRRFMTCVTYTKRIYRAHYILFELRAEQTRQFFSSHFVFNFGFTSLILER